MDDILLCDHSSETSSAVLSLFPQYVNVVLNFYSEEEIVWYGNLSLLNEASSAELSHGAFNSVRSSFSF